MLAFYVILCCKDFLSGWMICPATLLWAFFVSASKVVVLYPRGLAVMALPGYPDKDLCSGKGGTAFFVRLHLIVGYHAKIQNDCHAGRVSPGCCPGATAAGGFQNSVYLQAHPGYGLLFLSRPVLWGAGHHAGRGHSGHAAAVCVGGAYRVLRQAAAFAGGLGAWAVLFLFCRVAAAFAVASRLFCA